uniref:Uncharacterized protein n=1 Tax=Tanacetum cinerariifolium TaxID=118510 RepID=A0A6L2NWR1_TANCI|nr:hypothetical protein [Tanacetum cinerariifolium]
MAYRMTRGHGDMNIADAQGQISQKKRQAVQIHYRGIALSTWYWTTERNAERCINVNVGGHILLHRMDSEVMKGLSVCKASEINIRRIRVKDIVKKVKDYLKTRQLRWISADM